MRPVSPRGSAPRRRVYAACVAGLAAAALTASACDSNKGLDPATNVPSEVSSSGGTSSSESMNPHTTAPTPMTSSRASSTDASKTNTPSSSSTSTRSTAASVSPTHSSTHTTTPSPKPTLSAKDRLNAKRAFNSYNRVMESITHKDPATWKSLIDPVAGPEVTNVVLHNLGEIRAHNLVSYGSTKFTVLSVRAGPGSGTAIVANCQDSSHAGLVYSDGKKYNVGRRGVYDEATFGQIDGVWKNIGGPPARRKTC